MFSRSCLVSLMGMLEYMLVMSREANLEVGVIGVCFSSWISSVEFLTLNVYGNEANCLILVVSSWDSLYAAHYQPIHGTAPSPMKWTPGFIHDSNWADVTPIHRALDTTGDHSFFRFSFSFLPPSGFGIWNCLVCFCFCVFYVVFLCFCAFWVFGFAFFVFYLSCFIVFYFLYLCIYPVFIFVT